MYQILFTNKMKRDVKRIKKRGKNIAKLVGGGGGGRPNMAQAGGTNPNGIDDAFELAKKVLEEQIA